MKGQLNYEAYVFDDNSISSMSTTDGKIKIILSCSKCFCGIQGSQANYYRTENSQIV